MSKDNTIELSGLREDNPRDFLAALGILYTASIYLHISEKWEMCWSEEGCPLVIGGSDPDWFSLIVKKLASKDNVSGVFSLGRVEGIATEHIRRVFLSCQEPDRPKDKPDLEELLLSGLTGQIVRPPGQRRSSLLLEKASKSMLTGVRNVLGSRNMPSDVPGSLQIGASKEKMTNSPRLNPEEFRSAAYRAHDPENDTLRDVSLLNVFAVLGLGCCPVVDRNLETQTLGVERRGRKRMLRWPIWSAPLSIDEVKTILHQPLLDWSEREFSRRGILRVWSSTIIKVGDNEYMGRSEPMK